MYQRLMAGTARARPGPKFHTLDGQSNELRPQVQGEHGLKVPRGGDGFAVIFQSLSRYG